MPRQPRLDALGTLHHVLIRGIEQRPIVADEEDGRRFVARLGQLGHELQLPIYAWGLLPKHTHLIASGVVASGVGPAQGSENTET